MPCNMHYEISNVRLLLENIYTQTDIEMRDRIRLGADKVGGYSYTLGGPLNFSLEMAAGRINCIKSAVSASVNAGNQYSSNMKALLSSLNESWVINFNSALEVEYSGILFNLNGQEIRKFKIAQGSTTYELNNSDLAAGMYIL